MSHGRLCLIVVALLAAPLQGSPSPPSPRPALPNTGESQRIKVRPRLRFERASPESTLWKPNDSLADLMVRVTGAGGAPLMTGSASPVLLPVTFAIKSAPEGSTGHFLSAGATTDTASVEALTNASGYASATLHRGSGAGSYRVTATLPAEFVSSKSGVHPMLEFRVLTAGVPVELVGLSIEANHVADSKDSALVAVTALDVFGAPLDGAPLAAMLRLVDDPLAVPMVSLGGGAYSGRVASHHPGLRAVEVWDPRTDVGVADTVSFDELPGASTELGAEGEMKPAGSSRSLDLIAAVTDTIGSLLSAVGHPVLFFTDFGTLTPLAPDPERPWAHLAKLESDQLGLATVIALDITSGVSDTLQALFPAISLGREHHAVLTQLGSDPPSRFELPLKVFVPPPFTLGSGQLQILFPPVLASFAGFQDADLSDAYSPQAFPGPPGTVQVFIPPPHGPPSGGLIDLGLCTFDCEDPGVTYFQISNASLTSGPPQNIALPVAPAENANLLQKDYTCRICFNFIYSDGCGEDFEKKMEKALEELQKKLNEACCTIKIDKPTFCKVKDLGNASESSYFPDAKGGRQSRLSKANQDMMEKTKDCRKKECINVYVPIGINSRGQGGGMNAPHEEGEANVPNNFDGAGNTQSGSITDSNGKPISGKTDKDLSSMFFQCKPNGGANPFGQGKLNHLVAHEFGHMMGLGHYKKKDAKDKNAKENAMTDGGSGNEFTPEQCELIMKDINGFCLEVK